MQKKSCIKFMGENHLKLFCLVLFLMTAILAGCGSGGGSAAPLITSDANSSVLTGNFVDGPVSGLSYRTATLSGITGTDGSFQYRAGETITFSAGEVVLGSTTGKSSITPVDLSSGVRSSANARSVNICRFLQLIDADADHTNGIEITSGVRTLLTWNSGNGTNDGAIFNDETSLFLSTGTFAAFLNATLTTLKNGAAFTAATTRTLATRSATGARRNFNTNVPLAAAGTFSPFINEVGIGVTDLTTSMAFYKNALGLNFMDYNGRADRVEAVYQDNRSTNPCKLTLMLFNDSKINCKNHPVKIVFAVPNAVAAYNSVIANGGTGVTYPAYQAGLGTVGMAKDPDGYLLELIEASSLTAVYLSGVGLGVSSLQPIDDFYTRVIGMKFNYYLYVAGAMNETIFQSPLSPSTAVSYGMDLVLMDYFIDTGRVYTNIPVKVSFTVSNPSTLTQAAASEGMQIIQTPSTGVRGIAKDPNGYEIEFIQAGS